MGVKRSLIMRKEHSSIVFGSKVLRILFVPKRGEVRRGRIKLRNEELRNVYCSQSVIRTIKSIRVRWAGHVERMGNLSSLYQLLVGKPEGNRLLVRSMRRYESVS
jgi:hypothetical protein